jgi:hypothetical protein
MKLLKSICTSVNRSRLLSSIQPTAFSIIYVKSNKKYLIQRIMQKDFCDFFKKHDHSLPLCQIIYIAAFSLYQMIKCDNFLLSFLCPSQ